jgi:glycosyltransferase involved in cell wall biosynthesis
MLSTPIRLALLSSQKNWGGGEQLLWSLGQGLSQAGHSVHWVAPPGSALGRRLVESGQSYIPLNGRRPLPWQLWRLRRQLRASAVQLLHCNDSHAVNWGFIASVGLPKLMRVAVKHTVFPVRSAAKYQRMVDRLICVSGASRQVCLEAGIDSERLAVIHGGLDAVTIDRTECRNRLRQQLGLLPHQQLIVAVGSLLPCKGFGDLLEAMPILLRWYPSARLVLVGEGPQRGMLEQSIQQLGLQQRVQLVGFQSAPQEWMAASDLFVHPALSEGLSLVTIQAQLCGVPIVATLVGGLDEVMHTPELPRQLLGWSCPAEEPESLAKQIAIALSQPEESQRRADLARDWACRRFLADKMVRRFEEQYRQLLGAGGGLRPAVPADTPPTVVELASSRYRAKAG